MDHENPALTDPRLEDLPHVVVTHGPVKSLQEAALARGVPESAVIKTMVVRVSEEEYVFVLVPGDRVIDWGKLRGVLDVNRISLPDEATAKAVTGYARGTITPFGATNRWPVYIDERTAGKVISLGGGRPGVSITVAADEVIDALGASVADLTKPARPIDPAEKDIERRQ